MKTKIESHAHTIRTRTSGEVQILYCEDVYDLWGSGTALNAKAVPMQPPGSSPGKPVPIQTCKGDS
jgi:hypothetical protein